MGSVKREKPDVGNAGTVSKKAKLSRIFSHHRLNSSQNSPTTHPDIEALKTSVQKEYGNLQGTVFVPHVYMNSELLKHEKFAGLDVYIPQPPDEDQPRGTTKETLQESAVRNDQTHMHVLHCIQALTCGQRMTVVSQLEFTEYLSNPCYQEAVKMLPTPKDLPPDRRRGDFDILIIHPQFGFLIIEIKSVGDRFNPSMSDKQKENEVLKKLKLAIKQLNKEKEVLRHLVSDMLSTPRIKTALVLPHVMKTQLQKILSENPSTKTDLCKCLEINESDDPIPYCLFADGMSSKDTPWQVADAMEHLTQWWRRVFAEKKPSKSAMTDANYVDSVARFCGPATFVPSFQVVKPQKHHTPGEAISTVGDRFSLRVLTPNQIEVLGKGDLRRFVCGPPGTGKTVVLLLMAYKWLLRGLHVLIASTWTGSLAASRLIAFELKQMLPYYQERVHLKEFDLKEDGQVDHAVNTLLKFVTDDELFVICDEAFGGSGFTNLCTQLNNNCKKLHMWAASVYHGYCPPCLKEAAFCEPLRTPPVVTREVTRSDVIKNGLVRQYSTSSAPQPCDGPRPIWILHQGKEHTRGWTGDCEQCGLELGDKLWELCTAVNND
nr:hypothetical protein BaRGS_001220 [Batillaria attramentaria]